MSFLDAGGIGKSYPVGGTSLTVLRRLDLQVEAGEMLAIVGASGVGKTTRAVSHWTATCVMRHFWSSGDYISMGKRPLALP